jgi:hypothetical protein
MSRLECRSAVWKPFRESAIVAVLCVVTPIILIGQVIGLLYTGATV